MFWIRTFAVCVLELSSAANGAHGADFGRAASPQDVQLWNIDVGPDGAGLPEGSGSVARGKQIFEDQCLVCHGDHGQGGIGTRLVGGQGSLGTDQPVKTIGSYWPYAPTLFDYVRRAMPYNAPQTLSNDDTYAVVAYLLSLNGIVRDDAVLDSTALRTVQMPNRSGFVPDPEFSVIRNSRQVAIGSRDSASVVKR